jgi:hypothetical protein
LMKNPTCRNLHPGAKEASGLKEMEKVEQFIKKKDAFFGLAETGSS